MDRDRAFKKFGEVDKDNLRSLVLYFDASVNNKPKLPNSPGSHSVISGE